MGAPVQKLSIRNRVRLVLLKKGPFASTETIAAAVQPKVRGDKAKLLNLAVQVAQVRRVLFAERGIVMTNGKGRMSAAEAERLQAAWDKAEAKAEAKAARKAA